MLIGQTVAAIALISVPLLYIAKEIALLNCRTRASKIYEGVAIYAGVFAGVYFILVTLFTFFTINL